MICRSGAILVLCTIARTTVAAPGADELEARGQQLASAGHYSEAIAMFKQADRIEPRAIHACEIGLAYTRRELWAQAEIHFLICHERATSNDTLPDWVNEGEQLLHDRLAALDVAAVEIVVAPVEARAALAVSSFPPDESFSPRTIHLPVGHHVIVARAPGFEDAQVDVDVTDRQPRRVAIRMYRPGEREATPTYRKLEIAGGIALGGAAVAYGVMGICWLHLRDGDPAAFRDWQGTGYDVARWTSIPLWALGGTLLATGLYLRHGQATDTQVGALPLRGGAAATVGWAW